MSYLYWILMGLIVGVLARIVMPGTMPGGLIVTALLGIAGAFLGGFIGTSLGIGSVKGFNIVSILLATGGAVIIMILYRLLRR